MDKLIRQVIRNPRFQDSMGVFRGMMQVNQQILKRSKYRNQDIQNFTKNVSNDLEVISNKF